MGAVSDLDTIRGFVETWGRECRLAQADIDRQIRDLAAHLEALRPYLLTWIAARAVLEPELAQLLVVEAGWIDRDGPWANETALAKLRTRALGAEAAKRVAALAHEKLARSAELFVSDPTLCAAKLPPSHRASMATRLAAMPAAVETLLWLDTSPPVYLALTEALGLSPIPAPASSVATPHR